MKKYFFYLTCIVLTYSCNLNKQELNIDLIQGDWVSNVFQTKWKDYRYIFSFEDTLCTYLYGWGEYTSFKINDSLLLIKESKFDIDDSTLNNQIYTFKIVELNNEILQLSPSSEPTKSLLSGYDNINIDTIKFSKVKAKNNLLPLGISFSSSGCFGSCPSMLLEIDSSRNVKFYGHSFTKFKGSFKGVIEEKDYLSILKKIHNLQLDSIKENYSASWTDDQTCGIVIDFGNKTLRSRVYGFDKEPIELRILFHKLIEIYKDIDLQKASADISDFKHEEMYNSIVPPPPPPPK